MVTHSFAYLPFDRVGTCRRLHTPDLHNTLVQVSLCHGVIYSHLWGKQLEKALMSSCTNSLLHYTLSFCQCVCVSHVA